MRDKVIQLIEDGVSLKQISNDLDVNYNTVRQISVSNKLFKQIAALGLNQEQLAKLNGIGNNIRALSPIKNDKELLLDVIDTLNDKTTRNALEDLVKEIVDIKEQKEYFLKSAQVQINAIESKIEYYQEKLNDLDTKQAILEMEFKPVKALQKTNPKAFRGYLNLIGLYDGRYVLNKLVSKSTWGKMRKEKVILWEYGRNYIIDMEKFIDLTINTMSRNNYYEDGSNAHHIKSLQYTTVKRQLSPIRKEYELKLAELEKELSELKKSLKNKGKLAVKNYFEQRELMNEFTSKDTLTHTNIEQGILKYLYKENWIGTIELSHEDFQFDVVAYNDNNEIIIVEAKASLGDLDRDSKLEKYLNYCDYLYIASNDYDVCYYALNRDQRVGVIRLDGNFKVYKIIKEPSKLGNSDESIIPKINKKNARLLALGK